MKSPKLGCIVASVAFVACFVLFYYEFLSHHNVEGKLGFYKGGVLSMILFGIGAVATDLTRRVTSDFYSYKNLWYHYVSLVFVTFFGGIFRRKMEKDSRHVVAVQERILLDRLRQNENTQYGVEHGFSFIKSREDFVHRHPLTRYDHYEPYIKRVADGEENVMLPKRPVILAVTSGTSGSSKILPMSKKQSTSFFLYGVLPMFDVMTRFFPGTNNLQKDLKLFYSPRWRTSPAGIRVGPNSSSPANSAAMLSFYTTPKAAFDILSEPEALYVHLLFALKDRKLGIIEANFASLIYAAFVRLQKDWRHLVRDIHQGSINADLALDASVRCSLDALLAPGDEARAAELESEFERGFHGIARQIWPALQVLLCVDSGSFDVYGNLLESSFCKGVPVYSPLYAATEGLLGVCLWPQERPRRYLLAPRSMVYEFIPIERCYDATPQTLFLEQVEVGSEYEMVITNISGLYRYRFGDVIKVVDKVHDNAIVEFMYRQGQLLNLRGEKTSEKLFYEALCMAVSLFHDNLHLIDYCCAENTLVSASNQFRSILNLLPSGEGPRAEKTEPFYIVFVELNNISESDISLKDFAGKLDDGLRESYVYDSFRKKGSIGEPLILRVTSGAFSDLRQYLLVSDSTGSTTDGSRVGATWHSPTPGANQVKIPRVVRRKEVLDLLLTRVVSAASACKGAATCP